MSCTRPVITRISQHATRPLPSAVGTRRWDTMPFSVPAIIARACCCWCGGKKSMMRLIVSAASTVCSVESTRWPVSAALSAVWTVSSSRISPIRIVSGSCRSTRRSARLNDALAERVHAEAAEALDGVREVDLVLGLELADLLVVVEHLAERPLGVLGVEPLGIRDRLQVPVQADERIRGH